MQVMTGVYLFQIIMLALLGVKKFVYAPLMLPCIIGTGIFHNACYNIFKRPWEILSLRDATDLDEYDKQVSPSSNVVTQTPCSSWSPVCSMS